MAWGRYRFIAFVTVTAAVLAASHVNAQQGSGVVVDASGVLRTHTIPDPTGRLHLQRMAAARAALQPELARPSQLRKISLTRLEAEIAKRVAVGQGITDDMRYLAGLTRIRQVFIYPESGEIVVAGPAEGYGANIAGRVVGTTSGRATLELQDLVVALRAYPPSGQNTKAMVVSIDPTQEGLTKMRQFLVAISGRVTPADAGRIATGLKENLGLQTIRILGISPKTHFAQVMVEADYRMKLIGIGLQQPPVRIESYVARANPRSVARNALQRWYFTPNYDCVRVSDDRMAMELEGDGVKLISEDEMVLANGGRLDSTTVDRASHTFVSTFTQHYAELADKDPVYAQLRNLIDMAIAAAYIQHNDYYGMADWDLGVMGDESKFAVETYPEPKQVETAVNAVWKGSTLMTPIGGGVRIEPERALSSEQMKIDVEGELKRMRAELAVEGLADGQWWWD